MRKCRRGVRGYGRQGAQSRSSGVQTVVHPFRGLGRRHDPDVMMMCARRMNCVTTLRVERFTVLGTVRACHDAPFEKPPRTTKRQDQTAPFGRW
eukprot:3273523-Pleurochrysis_carterae.AAC.1